MIKILLFGCIFWGAKTNTCAALLKKCMKNWLEESFLFYFFSFSFIELTVIEHVQVLELIFTTIFSTVCYCKAEGHC